MIAPAPPAAPLHLAHWAAGLQRSVLRQMIAVISRPGILSFAGGLPDPTLFPTMEYAAALSQALAADPRALQYGPPYNPLKEHIVNLMAARGAACRPEQIFLTTGAQQALDVLARILVNNGDVVAVEEAIYTGMLQALNPCQPRLLTLPTDLSTGLDVAALEAQLEQGVRPAFIYVIPDGHNPLGVTLSLEKRLQLANLARRYGFPIIEDDPYGFLFYTDAPPLPPLHALAPEWVFYVGSFSKIIAPALRLGWMVAPENLIPRLTVIKEACDLESSALTQRAVATYLDGGHLPAHLETLRRAYGQRRAAMLETLEAAFPPTATWTQPQSGMFVWVELPAQLDTVSLLDVSLQQERVAFIPGTAFAARPGVGRHSLRLNFSNAAPERIQDGLTRLGRLIQNEEALPRG